VSPEQIAALPPGATLHDHKVQGLQVRAFEDRKGYYMYYRTKLGQERRPKLGDVGILTLTQARDIARKMLQEVAAGGDPVGIRKQHRAAPTVADLWDKFVATDAPAKTLPQYRQLYERYIAPDLGGHRLTTVQRTDVERLHSALAESPFQANRLVALIGVLFARAKRYGWLPDNFPLPTRGVRRYPEPRRERYTTPEEARAILTVLMHRAADNPRAVGYILLCLFTGARPEEITRARASWITGSVLRLPDSKTGARTIHLSPQALAIIAWLRPHSKPDSITGLYYQPIRMWTYVRKHAGCPDLRLYDLRHTFASAAVAATGSLDITGRLLGHTRADTTLIYAHLITGPGEKAASAAGDFIEAELFGAPLALPAPRREVA
jgi:integrase